MKQTTVRKNIKISGVSPYSGNPSAITIKPAAVDTGIVFLYQGKYVPVSVSNIPEHNGLHTTALSLNGIKIETTEHLLSVLSGLGINNAIIEVEGSGQIPVTEGVALDYVEPILKVGITTYDKEQPVYRIERENYYQEGDSFAILKPCDGDYLEIEICIKFPYPISSQCLDYRTDSNKFVNELAWARSFLRSDLNALHNLGGKNISTWDRARMTIKTLPDDPKLSPIICYRGGKYVSKPIKPDEPVRHKMMDFIGDFSIVGKPVYGNLKINWPGHAFNCNLARWFVNEVTKN